MRGIRDASKSSSKACASLDFLKADFSPIQEISGRAKDAKGALPAISSHRNAAEPMEKEMLNPTCYVVTNNDGEFTFGIPALDHADARLLSDIGLSREAWAAETAEEHRRSFAAGLRGVGARIVGFLLPPSSLKA
jgi:hypothetical protein